MQTQNTIRWFPRDTQFQWSLDWTWVVVAALIVLVVISRTWVGWWRSPLFPTPEEWTALWSVVAAIGATAAAVAAIRALSIARNQLLTAARQIEAGTRDSEARSREMVRHRAVDRRQDAAIAASEFFQAAVAIGETEDSLNRLPYLWFSINPLLARTYARLAGTESPIGYWISDRAADIRDELDAALATEEPLNEHVGKHRGAASEIAVQSMERIFEWQRGMIGVEWFEQRTKRRD